MPLTTRFVNHLMEFQKEVETMSTEELQRQETKYIKERKMARIGAHASILLGPLVFVGWGVAFSATANAAGKLKLITTELEKRNGNALLNLSEDVKGQLEESVVGPAGPGFAHVTASEVFGYGPEKGLDNGFQQASEAQKAGQLGISVTEIQVETWSDKCHACSHVLDTDKASHTTSFSQSSPDAAYCGTCGSEAISASAELKQPVRCE